MTSDYTQGAGGAGDRADLLWAEVQRRVAQAAGEKEADAIAKGLLTTLLAEGPRWEATVVEAARDDPRLACVLAQSSAGPRMYELLGRDRLVDAYIRFAQPKVPGWWDSWSWAVVDGLLQEAPEEGWSVLVAIADSAPSDEVLADMASNFLEELIERRPEAFVEWIVEDAPAHPKLRRAVQFAVRSGMSGGMIPPSSASERIVAVAGEPL